MATNRNFNGKSSCEEKEIEKNERAIKRRIEAELDFGLDSVSTSSSSPSDSDSDEEKGTKRRKHYECPQCLKSCRDTDTLEDHMRKHRDGDDEDSPKITLFQCPTCRLWFNQLPALVNHGQAHARSHRGTARGPDLVDGGQDDKHGRHECPVCYTIFTYIWQLNEHERAHYEGIMYGCEYCTKRFGHSKGLDKHRRQHQGPFKYKCEICSKRFIDEQTLRKHMKKCASLISNKKLQCYMCPERFAIERSLIMHMKTHFTQTSQLTKKQ